VVKRKKRDEKERILLAITVFLLVFSVILFFKPLMEFTSHFIFEPRAILQSTGISLSIDATPPEVYIFSPTNDTYLDSSLDLNYTAYDKVVGVDSVWYSKNNGKKNNTLSGNITLSFMDGTHKIFVYANDTNGKENSSEFTIFTVSETTEVTFNNFNGSTTNFSGMTNEQKQNIQNLTLEVLSYGKIVLGENINISEDANLDVNVEIGDNLIGLDSDVLPTLNVSATLILYNLNFNNPRILRNDVLCPATICEKLNYTGNNLTFSVAGFTNYSAEETPVEPSGVTGVGGGGRRVTIREPVEPVPEPIPELKPIHKKGEFFDVLLTIPEKYRMLLSGEELIAEIHLINLKKIGMRSVVTEYSIEDANNKVIFSEYETLAVENEITYLKKIIPPSDIKPGTYIFKIVVKYGDDTAIAGYPFKVIEKRVEKPAAIATKDYVYLFILALIIIGGVILFKLKGIKIEIKTGWIKKKNLAVLFFCVLLITFVFIIGVNYEGSMLLVDTYIPSKYERVASGESVLVESEIILRDNKEIVDVEIEYTITDSKNSIIYRVVETKGGIVRINGVKELNIPLGLEPGIYHANVRASYSNFVRSDSDSFEVIKKPHIEQSLLIRKDYLVMVLIIILLIFIGMLYYEHKKFKHIKKLITLVDEKELMKNKFLKKRR